MSSSPPDLQQVVEAIRHLYEDPLETVGHPTLKSTYSRQAGKYFQIAAFVVLIFDHSALALR